VKSTSFSGSVVNGQLKLDNRPAFDRITRLLDGKRVELTIRKFRKKRTVPQNSFYWKAIVEVLAEHFGYERAEDMHYELRRLYLSTPINEQFARVKSTTELSTEEFSQYMERCMQLAAENGVYIAFPDEVELSGSTV
jgi:hypothetical protein